MSHELISINVPEQVLEQDLIECREILKRYLDPLRCEYFFHENKMKYLYKCLPIGENTPQVLNHIADILIKLRMTKIVPDYVEKFYNNMPTSKETINEVIFRLKVWDNQNKEHEKITSD